MNRGTILLAIDFCNDQEGQLIAAMQRNPEDHEYNQAMRAVLRNVLDKRIHLYAKLDELSNA